MVKQYEDKFSHIEYVSIPNRDSTVVILIFCIFVKLHCIGLFLELDVAEYLYRIKKSVEKWKNTMGYISLEKKTKSIMLKCKNYRGSNKENTMTAGPPHGMFACPFGSHHI